MMYYRGTALNVLNRLNKEGKMDGESYAAIFKGLTHIEMLFERDQELEKIWAQFEDVPINPETECIEEDFHGWKAGTPREEIWHWFDRRHSKGVAYLLYGQETDKTPEAAKLIYLKRLCFECESKSCQFNHGGECRFSMVHEREPRITEEDGCIDFDYTETE